MNNNLANLNVFFRIKFLPPNASDTSAAMAKERNFYTANSDNDVIDYITREQAFKESKIIDEKEMKDEFGLELKGNSFEGNVESNRQKTYSSDVKRVKTSDEYFVRDGKFDEEKTIDNSGTFNLDGIISKDKLSELKQNLRSTESNIWHGIFSLDAPLNSELKGQEDAILFLKNCFPDFLKDSGFNIDNINMFASLHKNTDNRHIHFQFWEKEPTYLNSKGERKYRIKGKIDDYVIERFMEKSDLYITNFRENYYTKRDKMNLALTSILTPKYVVTSSQLQDSFKELQKDLPTSGRLQYNSKNISPIRDKVDKVVNLLIKSNNDLVLSNNQILDMLNTKGLELQRINPKTKYIKTLKEDYKGRLGNFVLALAKKVNFETNEKYASGVYNKPSGVYTAKNSKDIIDKERKHKAKFSRLGRNTALGRLKNIFIGRMPYIRDKFEKSLGQIQFELLQKQRNETNKYGY